MLGTFVHLGFDLLGTLSLSLEMNMNRFTQIGYFFQPNEKPVHHRHLFDAHSSSHPSSHPSSPGQRKRSPRPTRMLNKHDEQYKKSWSLLGLRIIINGNLSDSCPERFARNGLYGNCERIGSLITVKVWYPYFHMPFTRCAGTANTYSLGKIGRLVFVTKPATEAVVLS